ncbi:MAG: haloacid dehalogenase-like hydrolase [bacterium]|nr:haloacid dehalogenase-like hydrolase [bacterium]
MNISQSITENKSFFINNSQHIYIISGGFTDYIFPIVKDFDIIRTHILANNFIFNELGDVVGFDKSSFLSQEHGKVKQTHALGLEGKVWVIGDGYTDFQIKESGAADKFFAFTENVSRKKISDKADHITTNFNEFTKLFKETNRINKH